MSRPTQKRPAVALATAALFVWGGPADSAANMTLRHRARQIIAPSRWSGPLHLAAPSPAGFDAITPRQPIGANAALMLQQLAEPVGLAHPAEPRATGSPTAPAQTASPFDGAAPLAAFDPRPPADSPVQYVEKDGRTFLELRVAGKLRRMEVVPERSPRAPRVRFLARDVLILEVGKKPDLVKLTEDNLLKLARMMEILSGPVASLTNLMLRGEMGTGKNTLVYTLAGLINQGIRVQSFHAHTTERDLRYRTVLRDGRTIRQHSEFYEGAEAGDWVVDDEPNKPLEIGILTSRNTLLQNRWETLPGENRPVVAHPRFRAIALVNPPNRGYAVNEMPADYTRRYNLLDIGYMKAQDEVDYVMNIVFRDSDAAQRAQVLPLVKRIVGLADDIRSAYRNGHLPRPLSTRGVLAMSRHVKQFPLDVPYFREIFDPVYPTEYLEKAQVSEVEELLRQRGLQGQERPADFELPDVVVDEAAGKVRLGSERWGIVELPLGDLKKEDIPDDYRDVSHLPDNLRLWWALMKDRALGRHSLVLGESNVGKTTLAGHFLYALLRIRPEEQAFTPQTRGADIAGKPELEGDSTVWPPYSLERAISRDTVFWIDEISKPEDPGTVSLLNNVLQFGQILLPSARLLDAGPGFGIFATGTPALAQYASREFSAEVQDRFSTHIVRPLPAREEVSLVENFARKNGLPVERPVLEALQEAIDSLRRSYRAGLLPTMPGTQVIYRVILRLALYPDTKPEIEETFLTAFPAWNDSHEDIIRQALAPVRRALGLTQTRPSASRSGAAIPAKTLQPADAMNEAEVGLSGTFVVVGPDGIAMQAGPVTQSQYIALMGNNPSAFKAERYADADHAIINGQEANADHPVESVSWDEAQEFIQRLNASQTDWTYRLPTGREWDDALSRGEPYSDIDERAWHRGNSAQRTHALDNPAHDNPLGLRDMLGNVAEWVEDLHGQTSHIDGSMPRERALRGGSWASEPGQLSSQAGDMPTRHRNDVGFRLMRSPRKHAIPGE